MTKADQIRKYKMDNPHKTIGSIAKDLNYHYATVRHAVLSMNGKSPIAKKSVKKAKEIQEDLPTEFSKPNIFKAFCPICTKPVTGKVVGYQKDNNESYEHLASGTCPKCKVSFNMFLPNFKIENHKK